MHLVIMDERARYNPDEAMVLSACAEEQSLEDWIEERDEDFPNMPIVDTDTWEVVA